MVKIHDTWDGKERREIDRRECIFHGKHETLLDGFARELKRLNESDLVPMSTLKWWVGTIAAIFVSLFSISIYTSQVAISALHEIKIKQERTITKIEGVKDDILDIKEMHNNEMRRLDSGMDKVRDRLKELERLSHTNDRNRN